MPGENAEEPITLIAAPPEINFLITFEWFVEAPARIVISEPSLQFGSLLLKLGFVSSLLLITFPATIWLQHRLLPGCP